MFGECAAAFSAAAWGIAVAEEHREKEAKARLSQIESAARKDAESESKVISAAVAEAVQKERQRYIQDMHDGLGAELISTLSAVKNGNLPKEDIESALQSCLDQMRIAIDASGVSTEDFGTALANLRYRLAPRLKAAKLELKWNTLSLPDELSLPPQKAQCALRMVQEALTNAIKYSQATRVEVAARTEDSRLLLSVTDNGVGFKPEEPAAASATGSGLGLKGMRRRIEECGGTLSIESPETGGASVRLSLRKRFHFDPGLAIGLAGHTADNAGGFRMQIELSADMRKRQRVAERNEFGGFFARHDCRNAGNTDDVSLFRAAGRNDLESFRLHADNALSCC